MSITSDLCMLEGSSHSRWGGKDSDNEFEFEEPSSKDSRMEIIEGRGSMDHAIYKAAITGNLDVFLVALDDLEGSILDQISPQKNTILHIAASRGHDHLVKPILRRRQRLFKLKNSAGDLPIHLANKEASCCLNKEDKSPLYMAVEAGYLNLVTIMINYCYNAEMNNSDKMRQGKSIGHAAIETRNKGNSFHSNTCIAFVTLFLILVY
ncbi:hypothetical protein F0562_011460 [Nyssa sinensis]|uniref:Uncharacterized protein n=1 Tax=Nyssa sinensis TaxID=561372 RepID=A0A5J5A4U2_9ASTE|nr:hypothetical protein F0562_011460 [Nyssa sinensis]